MAIVGTAYVEVKAVTNKVRGQIRDGFQRGMEGVGSDAASAIEQDMLPGMESLGKKSGSSIEKEMTRSGSRSAAGFMGKFRSLMVRGAEDVSSKFMGLWGASGDKSGNKFGQKFWGGAQKFFGKIPLGKFALGGGVIAFLPKLISLIGQLSGGLFSLGSAIGQAAGSIGPLYSTMVPLMSILGGVKLAFSGLGKAIKDTLSGRATPAVLQTDLKGLGPAAKDFVAQIKQLKPEINALKQTAAKNLLPGLAAGIKGAMPLLGPFRQMIGEIDKSVGGLAQRFGQWLGGAGSGLMKGIFDRNVTSVRNLTGALLPLLKSFLRIYAAMQPVQNEFTGLIKRGAEWLNLWTRGHQDTMDSYFQRSFNRLRQIGDIVKNLVETVLHVGHAASQAGGSMLASIDKVTARWSRLTNTVGTQNKMQAYFASTVPVMKEVVGIIGDILKGIISMGAGDKTLMPLLQQIRGQLMPAIGALLRSATGPLAHNIVTLLTDIVHVLSDLTSGGGIGFLNSFALALDQVAKVVNFILNIPGIGQIAGYLLGIAGAVAAYGKVASMLQGFKLVQMITGIGTAAKTSAIEVDALSTSLKGEAVSAEAAAATSAAASKGGMFGAFRGKFGKAVGFLAAGQIAQSLIGGKPGSGRSQVGSVLSAAGTGAAIGSFFPGVGTAVGAAGGAVYSALQQPGSGAVNQKQLDALAKTSAGLKRLYADEAHLSDIIRTAVNPATKSQAEYQLRQDQTAITATENARIQAIVNEHLTSTVLNVNQATKQYTNTLGTHVAKVLQTSSSYDAFRSQLNALKAQVQQNGKELRGYSDAAISNRQALGSAAQAIFDHINAMKQQGAGASQVQHALMSMSSQLRDQATAAFGSSHAVDAFLGKLGLLPSKIQRTLAGLRALGLAAGGDLGAGFVQGIQQMQGASTTAAKLLADQTVKNMRFALQQRSPSKVTQQIGYFFGLGFVNGIKNAKNRAQAQNAAKGLADASLAALYQEVGKITTSITTRVQSLQQFLNGVRQAIATAIRTSVAATHQEQRALRKELDNEIRYMQNTIRTTLRSENNRIQTLQNEINNSKSAKARAGYIKDLAKVEAQRKQVLDLRDHLNIQEAKANKYLEAMTRREDLLAAHRQRVANALTKAQGNLQALQQAKQQVAATIKSGIANFTDITQVVPQGLTVTATRIVAGIQGRLKTVQQFATDIRTLIKRGLNKTMLMDLINQGPDVGGLYAHALVQATNAQISALNSTQAQINQVGNNLAQYVGDQFYDSGIKAAQGLIAGLKKKQSELDAAAAEMGRAMAKALKKALGIKSPSAVMRDEIGQHIPTGIAAGIRKGTPHAVRAIQQMNQKLLAASQVAMSPSLAAQQAAGNLPPTINGPLLAVEHLHVRDDSDITKIEQMLYRAQNNTSRAAGKRVVPSR